MPVNPSANPRARAHTHGHAGPAHLLQERLCVGVGGLCGGGGAVIVSQRVFQLVILGLSLSLLLLLLLRCFNLALKRFSFPWG